MTTQARAKVVELLWKLAPVFLGALGGWLATAFPSLFAAFCAGR